MTIAKHISRVLELGLVCYQALDVDFKSVDQITQWLTSNSIEVILTVMSQSSLSSCELALPDSGSDSCRDLSMTGSTSLPERFSEITFSSNCIQELVPGMCFSVKALIPRTCERFSVNFILNNPDKDIALHFNPRLPQNYVVRNSKSKGRWAKEEVASSVPFELQRGCDFLLHCLVTEENYLIAINGKHFASYGHRFPYTKVKGIEVRDIADVEVEQTIVAEYPPPTPFTQPLSVSFPNLSADDIARLCQFNETFLPMPCYAKMEERFTSGKEVHIVGRVKVLPHSFFINLQDSCRIWPHPNIPLHLNPRFRHAGKRNMICRNSWLNGKWDEEERCVTQEDNTFMPGDWFHLSIACHDEQYQICLNQSVIAEYPFRINPQIVNALLVQGDVKICAVFGNSLR